MAPRAAAVNVSFTVDSASEDESRDELNAFPTPDSNTENKAPARKPRGNVAQMAKTAAAKKATAKAKAPARRASGTSVLGVKTQGAGVAKRPAPKTSRKALAELQNANGSDTEEVDEFDADAENAAPVAVEVKTSRRGRPPKAKQTEDVVEEPAAPARKTRKAAEREPAPKKETKSKVAPKSRATKRAPAPEPEPEAITIPETQPDPELDEMDIEQSIEMEEIPESMPPPQRPSARRVQQRGAARQTLATRRAGSASDTERDPALRRKVGDLTKKLEAMTVKYDTLKEVASSGKENNFDQLKKRTEQTTKGTYWRQSVFQRVELTVYTDQDAVIKALKQQITEMQSRSSEISTLRKEMAKLEKENLRLDTESQKLGVSLASAHSENKTLSNKLTAARSSAPPENKNVLGSAVKSRVPGVVLPGTAEATKEAQFQKQKTELYSDLTNLIVLGVKKNEDEEEVYDCLQAGRNGSEYTRGSAITRYKY